MCIAILNRDERVRPHLEGHAPAATTHYGDLRARLEKRGTPIGPLDTLIAAHALSMGYVLVTHNAREFRRVPALRIEDWLA